MSKPRPGIGSMQRRSAVAAARNFFQATNILAGVQSSSLKVTCGVALTEWKLLKQFMLDPPEALDADSIHKWVTSGAILDDCLRITPDYRRAVFLANTMAASFTGADQTFQIIARARWCDAGFPKIRVGHKLAASLLVTHTTVDAADYVRAPWNAFAIELPEGLFSTTTEDGREVPLEIVLVSRIPSKATEDAPLTNGWYWMAQGFSDITILYRAANSAKDLIEAQGDASDRLAVFDYAKTAKDERTCDLITRLVVNTCLCMSSPGALKQVGQSAHGRYIKAKRRGTREPVVRIFNLTKPVRHDFREVVAQYLGGEGKRLNLQHMVAGHWKRQPHGKNREQRKVIWVEPYWRGPEDAPIALRSHILNDEATPTT